MTHPIAIPAREVIERALLRVAEPGCTCEPDGVPCSACAAIAALALLGELRFVAGVREKALKETSDES